MSPKGKGKGKPQAGNANQSPPKKVASPDEPHASDPASKRAQLSQDRGRVGVFDSAQSQSAPNQHVNSVVEHPNRDTTSLGAATAAVGQVSEDATKASGETTNKSRNNRNKRKNKNKNVNQSTPKEVASLAEPHSSEPVSKQAGLSQNKVHVDSAQSKSASTASSQKNDSVAEQLSTATIATEQVGEGTTKVPGESRNQRNKRRRQNRRINQSTPNGVAPPAEPHASDPVSKQAELSEDKGHVGVSDSAQSEPAPNKKVDSVVEQPNRGITHLDAATTTMEQGSESATKVPREYTSTGSQTDDREKTITSLTGQVAQWKKQVAKNEKQITTLCSENEKLRESLAQVSQWSKSDGPDTQFVIAAPSDEVIPAKDESSVATEQIVTARSDVDQLQKDLSLANSRIADVEGLHEAQLQVLKSVRDQIDLLFPGDSGDTPGKAETSLVDQLRRVEEWKNKHMEELSLANRERERLQLIVQGLELEKRNHVDQSRELEECLSQLDAVRRFTTTADKHTDTAITGMLQKLSAEIQQNTMFIAESISADYEHPGETTVEERKSAIRNISKCIGEKLANSLSGDDVALYLSIALQAYLSYHLCSIISSWTIDEGSSNFIKAVYRRLQEKEAQMISGNWRSLTRTYLESNSDSHILSTFAGFCDIIVASGYAASVPAAETMLSPFKDKLSTMISIAGQLSKMIGEVVSGDFEAFVVRPNEVFEETTMEEDVDDMRKEGDPNVTAAGQKVLCSTCLGLAKRVTLESGEKKVVTAIKAKVLVESFLEGA